MRNPVQEYSLARSMPIKALAAVLQGTSDMVSLIAAHTVLREKMEAVVAEKGMQAMQSAQAPKIKDKDLAMAQGLGASPADIDVPMGGIVGGEGTFGTGAAGGGSVVAFQTGGQPSLQTVLNQMSLQERTDYQRSGRLPERFRQMLAGETQMPEAAPRGPGRGTTFTEAVQAQGLGATPLSTDTMAFYPGMGPLIQRQATQAQAQNQKDEYYARTKRDPLIDYSKADMGFVMGSATDPGVATESIADFEKRMAAKETPGGGIADLATERAQVAQPVSFEAVTNQAKELAKKYKTDPGTTKDFTAFSKEYVDTLKEAGYDFDLVKDNIRKLAEEKEALKGEKKEAANLRLLEAGLGILGGESPYAFVNIGKGATPALQGLAKDLKDIKKTRRELDKETVQLNLLQNQMAEGKVKYAQGRLDKQEERQAKAVEKNAEIEFRIADRLSSNSIQKYVADRQFETSSTNLQATKIERAEKREADFREAALKQASEDVKAMFEGPEKEAKKLELSRKYYNMYKAKDFGAESGLDLSQWGTPKVKK
jgi:hypothetical protein